MPASFLIAVLLARHSDSLLAVFDRAVHGRSVRSARFLSQIDFRPTRGGAWTRLGSRILFGRGKRPKMPQNPASQVHALLGNLCYCVLSRSTITISDTVTPQYLQGLPARFHPTCDDPLLFY
jgi:hypothetical protein